LSVRSNIRSGSEVKILSESLNIMIEKLSDLIDTVKVEQNNLRDAELKLLQAQINPHFLYNTLDAIMWLAEADKKQEVIDMVGSLSEYFRTSLSKGNDLITLEEEILHIKSYLEIQQFRYKDILDYSILIPAELNRYQIPKITLQPLVENALYHGIKNKRGKGNITIGGKITEERILLYVMDNGQGMTKERVSQIMDGLKEKADRQETGFYGLFNVNERLHLYYGEESGLQITSTYTEGTTVEVIIPIQLIL
jgi:two-component system sensor histidine kinase YesM